MSKEILYGKSTEYDYQTTCNGNPSYYDTWDRKTTTTLPDGSTDAVYVNYLGQTS